MIAPASVVFLAVVLGQSPEAIMPVVPVVPPAEKSAPSLPAAEEPAPSLLAPVAPPPPEPTNEIVLQPANDGTADLIYEGRNFRARVARDGSVQFDDKQVKGLTPAPWLPAPVTFAVPTLQSTLRNALQGKPPRRAPAPDTSGPPPETTQLIPDVSRYRPDPREQCWRCSLDYAQPVLVNAFGRFDATDEIVHLNGQDPYRTEKARFLAATREARTTMAVSVHADDVKQAMAELPDRLDAIACNPQLSTAQKRGTLVALRDEMNASAEGREAADRISRFLTRFETGEACPTAQ